MYSPFANEKGRSFDASGWSSVGYRRGPMDFYLAPILNQCGRVRVEFPWAKGRFYWLQFGINGEFIW